MASFYGNDTGKHWQAYCEWNVTNETADTVTITGTTYFHSIAWSFQVNNINGRLTIDGNQNYTTGNRVVINNNQTANVALVTHTVTLVKGDSPRAITINAGVRSNSSYMPGYSEGAVQYTVPAKQVTTYTVTYNANGGTGAPSPQTKTKGQLLMLSNQTPTKVGYVFQGWSLEKNGVVNYKPGSAFSIDANTTLWAVWVYDRENAPVVTSLECYRVASSGSTTKAPNGSYGYIVMTWKSGSSLESVSGQAQENKGITLPFSLNFQGQTTGTVGTCKAWFSASTDNSYGILITLTNEDGQFTEASTILSEPASAIIEVSNQGSGLGLLTDAPTSGLALGSYENGDAVDINVDRNRTTLKGDIYAQVNSIYKPAISVGWEDSRGNACDLTSSDSIFPISTIFGQSGNSTSNYYTRIYRSGNYVYVVLPACHGVLQDACFEVSAQVRTTGIQSSNLAIGIYVEHTSGNANVQNMRTQIVSPVITWQAASTFNANFIIPTVISLPRSLSGSDTYRFSLRGRVSNATGVVQAHTMTIKMI